MGLVSSEPIVLIGPGSEWFWTALSGLVLAVTFLAIYRQLRLQRSAAAIEQLNSITREWQSERMGQALLAVLRALKAGEELPDRPASLIGDFWDNVGYLTRTGHVDRGLLHSSHSVQVQRSWVRLRPSTLAWRIGTEDPEMWSDFEWLAELMATMDAKRGIRDRVTPESATAKARLESGIRHLEEFLEIEQGLRTVPVRLVTDPVRAAAVAGHRHS